MDTFFIFSAKYLFVLPVLILAIYFLYQPWASKRRMVLFAIPALLLTLILGKIANHLISDPRPFVVGHFTPLVPHAPDNGFPSDHALLVTALAALSMYWNRKLSIVLWILALIVMAARVYVGIHHVEDVVGSALISLISVGVVYAMFKRTLHREVI